MIPPSCWTRQYLEGSALCNPALPLLWHSLLLQKLSQGVQPQLAPSPTSHVPKTCQLQNKRNITELVWRESYRAQQLPAVIAVPVLSVMLYFTFAELCVFALSSLLYTSCNQFILWLSSAKFFVDFIMTEVEKITYYK